jgi:hypothetical protein
VSFIRLEKVRGGNLPIDGSALVNTADILFIGEQGGLTYIGLKDSGKSLIKTELSVDEIQKMLEPKPFNPYGGATQFASASTCDMPLPEGWVR